VNVYQAKMDANQKSLEAEMRAVQEIKETDLKKMADLTTQLG
jgi:hypothetical protein